MTVQVVTARIYIDPGDECASDILRELFTTYASCLIDPDEREELLRRVWGLQVIEEFPAVPEVDDRAIIDDS